jgi:purine-binding chemotaxis protein CheW
MALEPRNNILPAEDAEPMHGLEVRQPPLDQAHAFRDGKYLVFTLGKERYGLDILAVREIIGILTIHELPQMPLFFKGVINLRDKIIPIMEMRGKFGMESVEHDERTCIIVVEVSALTGPRLIGIIVDAVSEVVAIKEQEVEAPPEFGSAAEDQGLLGVAKLADGVTILLDIDRLLQTEEAVLLGITA